MMMSPRLRKVVLIAHVATSVGWFGAVLAFLALAITTVTTNDIQMMRSALLAMELLGWSILVPLSVAALVTGLIQSLGTKWGLFQHYWIVSKLVINVIATVVLMLYMQTLEELATRAADDAFVTSDLSASRSASAIVHASAAAALLLVAIVLSIFKPVGMTRTAQRKVQRATTAADG